MPSEQTEAPLDVVGYDESRGMKVEEDLKGNLRIVIHVEGTARLLKNVKFYDPVKGFIQTADKFYVPTTLI